MAILFTYMKETARFSVDIKRWLKLLHSISFNRLRKEICDAAEKLMKNVGYVNAGTVEFLVADNEFYFIEVNPRIQVEHTITEMITGIDIVQTQIIVAKG